MEIDARKNLVLDAELSPTLATTTGSRLKLCTGVLLVAT
jgi:hypothetical protein